MTKAKTFDESIQVKDDETRIEVTRQARAVSVMFDNPYADMTVRLTPKELDGFIDLLCRARATMVPRPSAEADHYTRLLSNPALRESFNGITKEQALDALTAESERLGGHDGE